MSTESSQQEKVPVAIEDEMRSSFMDYAMSVIVSRALPDARDGLKPVHRRILYAMHAANNVWNRPYVKCARIVGDVLGKFHPHGDSSVYDALVRLAQDFAVRYRLIDGQGNFGSVDGDPPAAMRYTECRMARLASDLLADIDEETVDWQPNYDDKELEPTVLPTRVPHLLINGSAGIAVGMATNIPPHNLTETVGAAIALLRDPDIASEELHRLVPGPDFPTGGLIYGRSGIRQAFETGRGSIVLRAKTNIEEHPKSKRTTIVATEIPYQVNKARLIEHMAELVRDKRIEGIADLRDESDRDGMRIVIELKKDAVPAVVQNNLFRMTQLQTSFAVNMLAIVDGRPKLMGVRDALGCFLRHRREVVTRRCLHELHEARSRLEIVEGLGMAVLQIDRVIEIIRSSKDPDEASQRLQAEPLQGLAGFLERAGRPAEEVEAARAQAAYQLDERQAKAILEMRLQRLTGLERDKLEAEYRALWSDIDRLNEILRSDEELKGVLIEELEAVKAQHGDARRTEILDAEGEISMEDLIANEDMVVTVTHSGYIKRTPVSIYRAQRRGGRGVTGATTRDEDYVTELYVAKTHDHLLMLTNTGRAYSKRVYEVPPASRTSLGKALVNLLELQPNERVVEMLPVTSFDEGRNVLMATRKGVVKKTSLAAFANIRSSGIIAVSIDDDDTLVDAHITDGSQTVLLCTANGYAIRFKEAQVRTMGRAARGVRGIELRGDDGVVAMAVLPEAAASSTSAPATDAPTDSVQGDTTTGSDASRGETGGPEALAAGADTVLTVCERGFGKRTPVAEYPIKHRGGMGVISIRASERNGKVVGVRRVSDEDDLLVITDGGQLIRMPIAGLRVLGRATQGVRLIRLDDREKVVALDRLAEKDESDKDAAIVPPEEQLAEPEELADADDETDDALVDDDPVDDDGQDTE
jgi:DNA gyrase subunit A